jgi:hypothetical protein
MIRLRIRDNKVEIEAGPDMDLEIETTLPVFVKTLELQDNQDSYRTQIQTTQSDKVSTSMPSNRGVPPATVLSRSRRTNRAEAIENALREIGRPATATEIGRKMQENGTYNSNFKNADANMAVRQVMRSDLRFTKTDEGLWTLSSGLPEPVSKRELTLFDADASTEETQTENYSEVVS